jgi:hypothetical protein
MISDAADTTLVSVIDTIPDSISYQGYSIGSIIPLSGALHDDATRTFTEKESAAGYFSIAQRAEGLIIPQEKINTDFSFIILSVAFLLLTILSVFGRKSLASFILSLGFKRRPETVSQGTSGVVSWQPAIRNFFSVLSISMFVAIALLFNNFLKYEGPSGSLWLTFIAAGVFLAGIILRHFACIFVAEITGWKSVFREYMNVIYNLWFADAILLFILNAIILFSPVSNPYPAIIAGVISTAIMLIIRELRLLVIFLNSHISIFYYILYLCALEVLPVLVVLKLFGAY